MSKLLIGLLFSFFVFSGIQDNQIWLKSNMPSSLHIGDKFLVEFTINKLDLQHFAELKQKLPEGFKALEKEAGAANFSFNNQEVKFTWLRLPRKSEIKVSYVLVVEPEKEGEFILPAQFTYIYKNQRGTVNLQFDKLMVYPRGNVFISTENKDYREFHFPAMDQQMVQCLRVKPTISKDNSVTVKLLVSLGPIPRVARLEEVIPSGYTASRVDSKTASFSTQNNKVVFLWENMPRDKNLEVTYKLTPKRSETRIPEIKGSISFWLNGLDKKVPVVQVEESKLNEKPIDTDINKSDIKEYYKEPGK